MYTQDVLITLCSLHTWSHTWRCRTAPYFMCTFLTCNQPLGSRISIFQLSMNSDLAGRRPSKLSIKNLTNYNLPEFTSPHFSKTVHLRFERSAKSKQLKYSIVNEPIYFPGLLKNIRSLRRIIQLMGTSIALFLTNLSKWKFFSTTLPVVLR